MVKRPFLSIGIAELERRFDDERGDLTFLKTLIAELEHRKTHRAHALKERAVQALGVAPKSNATKPAAPAKVTARPEPKAAPKVPPPKLTPHPPSSARSTAAIPTTQTKPELPSAPLKPLPRAFTSIEGIDEAQRILLAWSALEVLSPQSFQRPEDLVSGDASRITSFKDGLLPWENGGQKSKPHHRLYYQVVLGSIRMESAVSQLLTVYTDTREERPQARGESILASIIVDKEGRPVENEAVAISSLGWGLPIALRGDLKGLGDWQDVEPKLVEALDEKVRHYNSEGAVLPLNQADIDKAYNWLVGTLGLDQALLKPPVFAVKAFQWFKIDEAPEPLLLNSFFLGDLAKARRLFQTKSATSNLKRYIGQLRPNKRSNLLRDTGAISDALNPERMPLGRWPSKGRHPLVALQQAAVNLAASDLKTDGILAVNGPPGTGKTTLLRDVVAHVVTERAKILASFSDPEDAFINSNLRTKKGAGFVWMYRLDKRLRGFEIVVASSNNKAVENVSAELPGRDAVAIDAFPNGYFKTVSDGLLERDTWGLIAAVLGNASNRSKFRQQFWWDDEIGMSRYLQHCTGTPVKIAKKDESGKEYQKVPDVILKENPPADKIEALKRWKQAKQKFIEAEKQASALLANAAKTAKLPGEIRLTKSKLTDARANLQRVEDALSKLSGDLALAKEAHAGASQLHKAANETLKKVVPTRPGFFSRLIRSQSFRDWKLDYADATIRVGVTKKTLEECRSHQALVERKVSEGMAHKSKFELQASEFESATAQKSAQLTSLLRSLGGKPIDDDYFELGHNERQLASPWLGNAESRVRDLVFEASINLQKAFVDAAAKPLRHNLNLLMDSFGVRSFGSEDKDALIPDIWASLFLVVPVISTTFASVGRMFARLGPHELGWLLIDEAGQALPQAAVGAIMRTNRAVVVGDPLQIEPVVMLPDQLTEAICREFKIDETRYNAPSGSAQTLSDSATSYFAAFETKTGSRDVGVPLLVHRRCADPMFSISNSIAYENLMVQAKAFRKSAIAEVLGPSTWIDVSGTGQDKWCSEEGDAVLDLLRRLKAANVLPDLYIVTPFVVVQDRMREKVRTSGILSGWVDDVGRWPYERIGTVHTVQGREAQAVIFVLGAPLAKQTGARNWAGGRPNLANVAVSRAQDVIYVIGNRALWERSGVFSVLSNFLR